MALTENGVSTTKRKGQFVCESAYSRILKREVVYWDYRDTEGELHTGTARTEEEAQGKASKFGYKEDA